MTPDSPLFPILEALMLAGKLNVKTHGYFHEILSTYSKEVQELYECAECKANKDKTAAMRMARMRQNEAIKPLNGDYVVSNYQDTPKMEGFDVNFALAMLNSQNDTLKIEAGEFTQKDMEELGNTLMRYAQSAERVCLQDISRTRKQLVFSIVSMLYLAQEGKLGFEQDEQKRIFIYEINSN